MTPSLILAGLYELVGYDTNPEYHLSSSQSRFDLGQPLVATEVIAGSLLDGDRVTGGRSGNRQIVLPVRVWGSDHVDLAAKVNALITAVDVRPNESFTLQWTPDGGYPVVYDCRRGSYTRSRILSEEAMLTTLVTLSFSAAPFGRSASYDLIESVAPTLSLDAFESARTGGVLDLAVFYQGSGSAKVQLTRYSVRNRSGSYVYHYYTPTDLSGPLPAVDISSFAALGIQLTWPGPANGSLAFYALTARLHLFDGTETADVDTVVAMPVAGRDWHGVTWALHDFTDKNPLLDVTAITSYAIFLQTADVAQAGGGPPGTSYAHVDDLRAFPAASESVSTPLGAVLTIPSVRGTARTPVNLTLSVASGLSGLLLHKPPPGQPLNLPILAELATHPPDTGVQATLAGTFAGTYSVVLLTDTAGVGGQVSVSVRQGTPGGPTQVIGTTVANADVPGKYVVAGEVTLPLAAVPSENTNVNYTIIVNTIAGFAGVTFLEVALCDTRGVTTLIPVLNATTVYIDEPNPAIGPVGLAYSTQTDRTAATSVTADADALGLMVFDPGDNRLLVATPEGVPDTVTAVYYARWHDEIATLGASPALPVAPGGGSGFGHAYGRRFGH